MTQPSRETLSKRAAQGRATREQLIEVATRLFAERGYEDTSIEAVLTAAGVSRGALYHHFAGKDALFEAVVESIENGITTALGAQVAAAPDAVAMVHTGALAWIDLAADPVIQRVILTDAPSVLGFERWRALNDKYAVDATRAMLQRVADEGRLAPGLVTPFAHMILGALDEMALLVARSDDREVAVTDGKAAVREFLHRLLGP
jgi:AcrR family transcriptional regulator